MRVKKVRRVDLDGFAKSFGFIGEIAGFTFLGWDSATSFRFRFHDREFIATGADKPRLVVNEVTAPNSALQPPPPSGPRCITTMPSTRRSRSVGQPSAGKQFSRSFSRSFARFLTTTLIR